MPPVTEITDYKRMAKIIRAVLIDSINRGSNIEILLDSNTVRIPRHSDTQSRLIRTVVPRSSGQAVGAQRRRGGILSPRCSVPSTALAGGASIRP